MIKIKGVYKWLPFLLCLVLAGWLAGCGEPAMEPVEEAPLPEPEPVDAEAVTPEGEEVEPAISDEEAAKVLKKKTSEFVYDPINKADPFNALSEESDELLETEGPLVFELRFYNLRAILWGSSEPIAMFEDPKGSAFALHVGDEIGKERGKIVAINPDGVQVQTEFVDFRGQVTYRPITILLHP